MTREQLDAIRARVEAAPRVGDTFIDENGDEMRIVETFEDKDFVPDERGSADPRHHWGHLGRGRSLELLHDWLFNWGRSEDDQPDVNVADLPAGSRHEFSLMYGIS